MKIWSLSAFILLISFIQMKPAYACPPLRPSQFVRCGEINDTYSAKVQITSSDLEYFSAHRLVLENADLSFSKMSHATLREVSAEKAKFLGVQGKNIKITGGSLKSADFSKSNLESCVFKGVYAPFINFKGANLKNCRFIQSYFFGAQWSGADLNGATFENSLGHPSLSKF